jgi:ATP-binding cassette subfamily B protein
MVWQSAPGWTLANLFLTLIQGLLPLVALFLLKLIVDEVTAGLAAPDKTLALQKTAILILLAGLAALISSGCRGLADYIREAQSQRISDHVADVIHTRSVTVDLTYYEDPKYHDTLHRAQREAAYRPTAILTNLLQLGQSAVTFLALTGLLLALHWAVAVMLVAAAFPGVLLRLAHAHRSYDWQRRRTLTERQSHYFHWVLTDSGHAKEIRLFGLGELLKGWFRELREKLFTERLHLATRRSLTEFIAQASAIAAIFGTLAYIAHQTVLGVISLGGMVMYYQAFQRAQGALQEILASLANLYEANLFLSDFDEFLNLEVRLPEPANPLPFPRPLSRGILFKHVNFQYPTGQGLALEDVTLEIPPGRLIALVGENGSGKTTLIKLLCRLYDPTAGSITIDGIDLSRLASTSLRQEISVIFQDFVHYFLSARENIWLGDIGLPARDDRITEAARLTGADAVIQRLPRGYDTILGHWFAEQGELSLGEWQRVALARALLKRGQIIILDEPTGWMDARAEHEVFQSFRERLDDRSALLISHRFSTVRLADYIYVLDQGKIIEQGAHQELLRLGGRYAHLFHLQVGSGP